MIELPIIRCNLGMRGYGKSTLARAMARPRVTLLVNDPMKEHEALALEWTEFEEYIDAWPGFRDYPKIRAAMVTPGCEALFCAICWEIGQRVGRENELSMTVLLEEADLVAPPGHEPWIVKRLASQGRHHGIELIACSRRPAEVSRYLTANADEINVFRTQEPKDLTYLRGFIELEAVDVIAGLGKFEFVHWTPGGTWEKRLLTDRGGSWATASGRGLETKKNVDGEPAAV